MGSNGFSSENKQQRVDLLKKLLSNNSTQASSDPETLLSGLDLSSLEGLLKKNKKSHHDDWDSKKKKSHHDDWDHKKKSHKDDCGCHKHDKDPCDKKHDWDHKKKSHEDDCGCHKHKHECDCDCDCKNKKRCKCSGSVKADICEVISFIFGELEATSPRRSILKGFLEDLQGLLETCSHIPQSILNELDDLIDALGGSGSVSPGLISDIEDFLDRLLNCLGFRNGDCGSGGGGGGACGCDPTIKKGLCLLIGQIRKAIGPPLDSTTLLQKLTELQTFLNSTAADCLRQGVRASLTAIVNNIIGKGITPGRLIALGNALDRLEECLGGCIVSPPITTPTTPVTTVRERLLDLLTDQVVVTTATGIYPGTLVAVQVDYIAIVAPGGTYLVPIDDIQTFTTA